jgi:hypothetical protein
VRRSSSFTERIAGDLHDVCLALLSLPGLGRRLRPASVDATITRGRRSLSHTSR